MTKTYVSINGQSFDASRLSLPSDRKFRDAWDAPVGGVVQVDMTKAKSIHRDRIRADRNDRFDPYDSVAVPLSRKAALGQALTATELSNLAEAEEAAKALRDAPADPRIDACSTPEELARLTLDALVAP